MGVEFLSRVEGGRLLEKTRHALMECLRKLEGKRVRITVTRIQKKRSLPQNAYWWSIGFPLVKMVFEDAGNDCDVREIWEYTRKYIWGWTKELVLPDGQVESVARSSTEMSTTEWMTAMEKSRAWLAQFGYTMPAPGEGAPVNDNNFEEGQDHEERDYEKEADGAP